MSFHLFQEICVFMNNLITPKKAADMLSISVDTLRLWEIAGKIQSMKTLGGHRRYLLKEIENIRYQTQASQNI